MRDGLGYRCLVRLAHSLMVLLHQNGWTETLRLHMNFKYPLLNLGPGYAANGRFDNEHHVLLIRNAFSFLRVKSL